ncbi:MAG: hypothetical protein P8N76_23195 [Pirellulaceae bacterium]|nr:hypothetical protein [Planctomycetaceae bacterium]MDG2384594.1 hypothetical protein [Pirellulaceae bacterium]
MATHATTWEDDDCNRLVQLSVDYQIVDSRIEIEDVTPTEIRFVDADGQVQRQIRVWTEKGRNLLSRQHAQRVGAEALREQLESELAVAAR